MRKTPHDIHHVSQAFYQCPTHGVLLFQAEVCTSFCFHPLPQRGCSVAAFGICHIISLPLYSSASCLLCSFSSRLNSPPCSFLSPRTDFKSSPTLGDDRSWRQKDKPGFKLFLLTFRHFHSTQSNSSFDAEMIETSLKMTE